MNVIKHMLTGADNQTWDIGRLLWALGVLSYLGLAGYALAVNRQPFDYQAFGIGLAAVLTAGGAGIALKAGTEPKP